MTKPTLKIPLFVRARTIGWGVGGTPFASYIAALADVPDLSSQRVLGVGGNADLLLAIVNERTSVAAYTAVEPDHVTAAFFASYLESAGVELVTSDIVDHRERTLDTIGDARFDVMIVRHPALEMTRERVTSMLSSLRTLAADGCTLIMMLALAEQTVRGEAAADYVAEHDLCDLNDDYAEIEWTLGTIPLFSRQMVAELGAASGWALSDVCEPRRGFQQHHVVLTAT